MKGISIFEEMQTNSAQYKPLKLSNMKELIIQRVLITPQLANEYLRRNTHNRPIKSGVVKYYASEMKQGNWRCAAGATIIFDWNKTLQDGQHRLQAIIQSGCSIWMYVIWNADPDDFTVIDTGKTRGASDTLALCDIKYASQISSIIKSYIQLSNRMTAVRGSFVNASSAASASGVKTAMSNKKILDEYNKKPEYWQEIVAYTHRYRKTKILTMSFIGALYAYLHLVKSNSEDTIKGFFDGIRGDSNESPIVLLRDRLIEDMAKLPYKRMTSAYKQKLVAKAWNHYRRGSELKCLRVQPDEDIDFD